MENLFRIASVRKLMYDNKHMSKKDYRSQTSLKLWILVIGLSLGFLIYGLFVFAVIGDKGPPGWNFGNVDDLPGKSVYSTSPEPTGNTGTPETQHISKRASKAPELTEGTKDDTP